MKVKQLTKIALLLTLMLLSLIMMLNIQLKMFWPKEAIIIPYVTAGIAGKPKFLYHLAGGLSEPLAVAVDSRGYLYIADSGNNKVRVYKPNGNLNKIYGTGVVGGPDFNYPNAIVVDRQDLIYVGEFKAGRVQVFNFKADSIQVIDAETTGLPLAPLALAVDKEGRIYVANLTGEVFVLDKEGQVVLRFGEPGTKKGQLSYPNGIAVDPDRRIVVSDSGNARIQVFNQEGKFLHSVSSIEFGVSLPRGIAAGKGNRFYVADVFGHQIVELDEGLQRVFSFGQLGQQEGELKFPNGVAVDSKGNIYVAERGNNRVSVFGR